MKNTLAKVISTLMIITTLLGFAAVFTVSVAKAAPAPLLFVDPQKSIYYTAPAGTSFLLNVSVANITMLAGIQFSLAWDPTLLKCNSMTEVFFHDTLITAPDDNPSNINVIKKTFSNTAGTATYGVTWVDGGLAQTDGYDPANITTTGDAFGIPGYAWPEGKHGVATFNFTVLQAPNSTVPLLSSALHISNDILGDLNGLPIAHTNVDGLYQNIFTITPPQFSVGLPSSSPTPYAYTAHSLGEVFDVPVYVNNLDASFQAVGFQFSLGYNSTLLHVQHISEGPWLPPFGATPNNGTSFLGPAYGFNATINQDYVEIGDVVLPDPNGTWHAPFPSGTGVLAIIEFNATLQNTFPAPDLTCPLTLFDTIVANTTAAVMPQILPPVSGTYTMKSLVLLVGRVIDIFTGWPAPYGGQGPNQPSDMFWPQKPVSLYANVTYNGYPEQQKDVAFQIIAPNNQTWAIIYATSDVNGIAYAVFTLPWPCDDPQQWFGVWTIIGTVDIACVVVNDTLQFHYDYLARIFKQTTSFTSYNHLDYVTVNVTYGTHLQQTDAVYLDELTGKTMDLSNVTVVITAFDEVRVPYGTVDAQLQFTTPISANSTMEPFGGTVWCQYKNFTVSLTFQIPKFAVAGNSEIDCAVLSNWPYFGGEVISGFQVDATHWLPYDPTPIYINPA